MPEKNKRSVRVLLMVPMLRRFRWGVDVVDLNDSGLGYLASACKRGGAEVILLSWNVNHDRKTLGEKLAEFRPDIVGLKVFTTLFNECCETLRCIRSVVPGAVTIIGGPHPSTSRPEDIFAEFDGLLDFAMAGDAEVGMVALIENIASCGRNVGGKALSSIPGLIYRDGDEVRKNEPCLDMELDSLAPLDWSLQQPRWFGASRGVDEANVCALVLDSRGCSANCAFCKSSGINGSIPRKRSLKLLCGEIEELARDYGVRTLVFTGNAFMSDVDYVRELCEWFMGFDYPLKWTCTGAAWEGNLRDRGLLELMQRAGCTLIHYGIESGNSSVRRRLRQPTPLEKCTEIVKITAEAGIRPACYFMFGHPHETVEEMNDTIKYAFSLPYYSVSLYICLPLPGTSAYEAVLEKYGLHRIDWSTYDFAKPKLLPCKASLGQLRRKFFEARVLRKSRVARQIYRFIH